MNIFLVNYPRILFYVYLVCFPNLRNYVPHMLSPRSKNCILGYPSNYKGFRCFDPLEKKFFISLHIILQEDSFLYPSLISKCISPKTSFSSSKSQSSLLFPSLTSPNISPILSPNKFTICILLVIWNTLVPCRHGPRLTYSNTSI